MSILKLENVGYRYKDVPKIVMFSKMLIMSLNKEKCMQ